MDILSVLLASPALQQAALMLLTKYVADRLKSLFEDIDENGIVQGYKVYVQALVLVSSLIVELGKLALTGQLHTVDVKVIIDALNSIIMLFLGSQGVHAIARSTFLHFLSRKTILKR